MAKAEKPTGRRTLKQIVAIFALPEEGEALVGKGVLLAVSPDAGCIYVDVTDVNEVELRGNELYAFESAGGAGFEG